MNDRIADQLDAMIDDLLAGGNRAALHDVQLDQLRQIAAQLQSLPHPEFRAQLRAELETGLRPQQRGSSRIETGITPPLFLTGPSTLPVRGSHLALSFVGHVVAVALFLTSGWWMVKNQAVVRARVTELLPSTEDYLLPIAPGVIHGGGGGGDQDKLAASHGTPPRFAAEQLTPPAVIVRNEAPKLPAEPTVIGPPDLVLPQSDKYGDPMANILNPPSNGPGSGGGIGSGRGGGVGSGEGPGVGEGKGGGIGGGIYHVGGGVSAPRPIYDPDPEYSEQARKAKFQGSVLLVATIGPDGRPRDLHIARSLGMGLDEKALEAVRQWRFAPAMKGNQPVSVQISIEVAFRLY